MWYRRSVAVWIALVLLAGIPDAGAAASVPDGGMPAVPADWGAPRTPMRAPAAAVGYYSAGCLQGGVALGKSGPGYEVLRLSRRRHFGHPALVEYIRQLGAGMKKRKLGLLLVGDLAQPRGGPTLTGHRSHQTGLDVDLGYGAPPWAARRRFTPEERESTPFPTVVDLAAGKLNGQWEPRVATVLELAASHPGVDRIFVNPVIKRELCAQAPGTPWLRKLRPWWGHHDHFHVRLSCPAGDPGCQPQEPLPADDGCAKLAWWFTADARTTRQKRSDEAAAGPPPLPGRCREVLSGK